MFPRVLSALSALFLLSSCFGGNRGNNTSGNSGTIHNDIVIADEKQNYPQKDTDTNGDKVKTITGQSRTARILDSLGYINIREYDPRIAVKIIYATPDNFVGEILYDGLSEAYLLPEAAEKLSKAQGLLEDTRKGYRLLVYDAARPMPVQKKMWDIAVKQGKQYYVANPAKGGGLHNYGAAVDVTIIGEDGSPLPMGTDYDYLGSEANTDKEEDLVRTGKITRQELDNRLLLRKVMTGAGFRTIKSEWWHFNLCLRDEAVKKYPLIDF